MLTIRTRPPPVKDGAVFMPSMGVQKNRARLTPGPVNSCFIV